MAKTQADLEAEIAALKQAVSDTAQRVSDKLASLNPASPDYTDDVQSLKDDIDALASIAPAAPTAINPTQQASGGSVPVTSTVQTTDPITGAVSTTETTTNV